MPLTFFWGKNNMFPCGEAHFITSEGALQLQSCAGWEKVSVFYRNVPTSSHAQLVPPPCSAICNLIINGTGNGLAKTSPQQSLLAPSCPGSRGSGGSLLT